MLKFYADVIFYCFQYFAVLCQVCIMLLEDNLKETKCFEENLPCFDFKVSFSVDFI